MSNAFKGLPLNIRMANNEPDRIFIIEDFTEIADASKQGTTEYIDYSKVTKLTILLNDKIYHSNNVIISFFDVTAKITVSCKNASGHIETSIISIKRGVYEAINPHISDEVPVVSKEKELDNKPVVNNNGLTGFNITLNYGEHHVEKFKIIESHLDYDSCKYLPTLLDAGLSFYVKPNGVLSYYRESPYEQGEFILNCTLKLQRTVVVGNFLGTLDVKIANGLVQEIIELPDEFLETDVNEHELPELEAEKIIDADSNISDSEVKFMEDFVNRGPKRATVTMCTTDQGTRIACIMVSGINDTEIIGSLEVIKQKMINALTFNNK